MSLEALVQRLANRVRLTVGRAVLAAINDGTKLQSVQVELLQGEVRDNCERFQDYGFTSHPFPGAEGVGLAVGASRDHVVLVAVADRRFRLTSLEQGEVAIYTDEGDKIVLKRGNQIEVVAATKVSIVSPLVEMSGDLHVAGALTVTGDATAEGISLAHHKHTEQGDGALVSEPV